MIEYIELAGLADKIFEISGDDDEDLADVLDTLDPETREALLASDLLNAYQVYYYHFRKTPDELVKERLQLHAASDLAVGVVIDEVDDYEAVFIMADRTPMILITDGDAVLVRFEGPGAIADAYRYLDEHL
jgi:hypothetical protein